MTTTTLSPTDTRALAGAVRAWAIAVIAVIAVVLTMLAPGGVMAAAKASDAMASAEVLMAEEVAASDASPATTTCVAEFDTDKDTADREFTSPPAAWLAIGLGADALGHVRALTPQFAAPPPQRPPRLAA